MVRSCDRYSVWQLRIWIRKYLGGSLVVGSLIVDLELELEVLCQHEYSPIHSLV